MVLRLFLLAAMVPVLCALLRAPGRDDVGNYAPERIVEEVITSRHGLARLSGARLEVVNRIQADPNTYAPVVASILSVRPDQRLFESREETHRIGNAIHLAGLMGAPELQEPVRRFFDEVDHTITALRGLQRTQNTVSPDASLNQALRNGIRVRNATLLVLGKFGDGHAVDACVAKIEAERRSGDEVIMLQYLEEMAPLRPDIRPALILMFESEASPMWNNPDLRKVIESIDKAEAERRAQGATRPGEEGVGAGEEGKGE